MVGKTSIVAPIYGVLKSAGYEVIKSREPGGTPEAEIIRRDIFKALRENVGAEELAIMFSKARKIHLDQVLIPHLGKNKEKNTIALIDRYASTTRVLQGVEGGVPQIRLRQMEDEYAYNFFPDLTILMYFPENIFEKTFLERKKFAEAEESGNRSKTLWDEGDVELQLMRQRHYLNLPMFYRETGVNLNFETLDASRPIEVVTKDAIGIISRIIKEKSVTGQVPPEQLVSLYEEQKRR
jgi:dTMP kinase